MKKHYLWLSVATFMLLTASTIHLANLYNYANQGKPSYILKDNTNTNAITDAGATLGRVLFYDKKLSLNNTISCASCHQQQFAFSDTARQSVGLFGGKTGRHSMRLVNARFGTEQKFFWDERAATLEIQTTQPIQDHVEMGFSGNNGLPDLDSLIRKMQKIEYYNTLFKFVYGDSIITENRMRQSLAQFVRSIQSFDSKFDIGLAQANNNLNVNFANFTTQENQGKALFLAPPPQGAGCQGCHRAPEFDIDPNSLNNGVIGIAGSTGFDLTNTKAPSLRNLFNPTGTLNGPLMHNGVFTSIEQTINHYNLVPNNPANTNLDNRLAGPGGNLQLTQAERSNLAAFLRTLTGNDVYTNLKWSDPFDANGNLVVIPTNLATKINVKNQVNVYPNPASDFLQIDLPPNSTTCELFVYNASGQLVLQTTIKKDEKLNISQLKSGNFYLKLVNTQSELYTGQFLKY